MASPSSDPMDDGSFRSRVHKVFSSLSSSPSSASPALKPLWTLTDAEVEKRDWNRSKEKQGKDDDETICSSAFDGLFKRNRDGRPKGFDDIDLSGYEDGDRKGLDEDLEDLSGEEDGDSTDIREIRSSIGLDSTLDHEEEEDEYDRFAEGKEKTGNGFRKDPRADQVAAELRLKEDDAEAAKQKPKISETQLSGEKSISGDRSKLKPILKRKDNGEVKSRKRVRFDPSFIDESQEPQERPMVISEASSTSDSLCDANKPKVPDHLINPSKYTRYSLDSCSEIDNDSNSLACGYVLEEVKNGKHDMKSESSSTALLQSISFVPKNKKTSSENATKECLNQPSFGVSIAAVEAQRVESATTEEDGLQMDLADDSDTGVCKPDRHYRSKSSLEDHVT